MQEGKDNMKLTPEKEAVRARFLKILEERLPKKLIPVCINPDTGKILDDNPFFHPVTPKTTEFTLFKIFKCYCKEQRYYAE